MDQVQSAPAGATNFRVPEAIQANPASTKQADPFKGVLAGEISNLPEADPRTDTRGFVMRFPAGFPPELKEKLERMFNDPAIDKHEFISMFLLNFADTDGHGRSSRPWNQTWRSQLKSGIHDAEQLKCLLSKEGQLCQGKMIALMKQIFDY